MHAGSIKSGDTLEPLHIEVTEEMVTKYGEVSGDFNPIHFDDRSAREKGFPSKIIHGMFSMAIASHIIDPYLQEGYRVKTYEMKFKAPVLVGETIRIEGTVKAIEKESMTVEINVSSPTYPQVAKSEILLHVYK
ncbi:MaoC family dehydratase [Fictibacillus phosphorivorans]|uniref:MaoC family dehydratase n=1 Tax=Fictibacillus phosphorivorans TaxID=1221500 RepID=UPI0020408639|nr:MaoC/PaaZ C-terminal domain-containing protein [Fictibacillus phosphorivorans]MCM3717637.1 MaoC family dehydratase N-terminal domain-containing protein [Fictibacillus phosphorivorans]MCM3775537.1 MaoC family dehydratase N-terminal domain-containing protein [Fictibacillus phosphorivorans]